jgi:hypothetical protein
MDTTEGMGVRPLVLATWSNGQAGFALLAADGEDMNSEYTNRTGEFYSRHQRSTRSAAYAESTDACHNPMAFEDEFLAALDAAQECRAIATFEAAELEAFEASRTVEDMDAAALWLAANDPKARVEEPAPEQATEVEDWTDTFEAMPLHDGGIAAVEERDGFARYWDREPDARSWKAYRKAQYKHEAVLPAACLAGLPEPDQAVEDRFWAEMLIQDATFDTEDSARWFADLETAMDEAVAFDMRHGGTCVRCYEWALHGDLCHWCRREDHENATRWWIEDKQYIIQQNVAAWTPPAVVAVVVEPEEARFQRLIRATQHGTSEEYRAAVNAYFGEVAADRQERHATFQAECQLLRSKLTR